MRGPLSISLSAMLLAVVLAGCGSGEQAASPSSVRGSGRQLRRASSQDTSDAHESLAAPRRGDSDGDSSERAAFDGDDFHSMHFGHAADPADWRTIAAIVKRYYHALAAEDGDTVCSLLLGVVAETLPEGGGVIAVQPGDATRSCPATVSDALAKSHRALSAEDRTLRVVGVRVRRRRASAILRFGERSARHILLYKEGSSWKIGTLADEDLG